MPRRLNLPDSASTAEPLEDGRLFAPSAARNANPLCEVLTGLTPDKGRALELASGTGQHIVRFAMACPGLIWVPTDIDAARLASIRTYVMDAELPNLAPPMMLDATAAGWGAKSGPIELLVLVNLLHLISVSEAQTLISEAAAALAAGGQFLIYGPFLRGGEFTSDGDAQFHASLIGQDEEIGYKDDFDVIDLAQGAGLTLLNHLEMPANNLALVFGKPEYPSP